MDFVDEEKLKYFAEFTTKLDNSRNVSFQNTFPELYEDLKEYFV
jgi:predicted methyltransferase